MAKNSWQFSAERITACRELMGISPEKLAKIIGVTAPTVRSWERGATSPDGRCISKLANAFKMTPYGFFAFVPEGREHQPRPS